MCRRRRARGRPTPWPPHRRAAASPSPASPTTTPTRPPRPAATSSSSRPAPRSSTSAPTRFDPSVLPGNIEHFTGVAQVPLGIAGPLLVDGEHAQGEFYVPLATAEGTLVASYNRGMKLLHEAGGVKTTIMDDRMQRAPAFLFENARGARDVRRVARRALRRDPRGRRVDHELRPPASTSSSTRPSRILYTRFNYTTGDAAGQNMTGKATQAACHWILEHYPGIDRFFLEGNFATDKKSSQINMLRTRGKRVVAEAVIPDAPVPGDHALEHRADVPGAPGLQPRRLHVRRQQQRRPLRQRHHRDVHRHRPGRRQRRRVLRRVHLRRAARGRRLLLLGHDPVADRRHLRRRHRARHPARVPRAARLLRRGQGAASSPRSSRPPCCAASSRSARRSWPRSGSTPTTSTGATGPSGPSDRRGRARAAGRASP